ncbi:hypothetical protein EDD66_11314 [Mobilisporobacter senegalensis]|uniref:CAAX prenyl protease 2/Lysostaphin resistance protein A-like domain-containing protein n=1 Tax=Mobilisporobacter senegalensis TaxID=1329262 RepID=A0A3N1XBZ4_9FIRM|nr:CPBP family intramembrane glutamic endopeptidase [Mobilisporobacter senegalensis]ROR23621.1 hypothetical protein EDD66_11314 [Mobilisporobacter senegalensis]
MYRDKGKIILNILIIYIFSIIIWNLIKYLNEEYFKEGYNSFNHFLLGVITSILSIILIAIMQMINTGIRQLRRGAIRSNLCSFLLGVLLWTIPAFIGAAICLVTGWVEITVRTDFKQIIGSYIILFITVFLIEGLPEELIFRGFIYKYLNVIFPHWLTLVLQVILFTVFGYFIGSIYSIEQLLFLPGFAFILSYLRAVSGSFWTSTGFHVALMTTTQILSPIHNHFIIKGADTLKFLAFILIPSILGFTALSFIYPGHRWSDKVSCPK